MTKNTKKFSYYPTRFVKIIQLFFAFNFYGSNQVSPTTERYFSHGSESQSAQHTYTLIDSQLTIQKLQIIHKETFHISHTKNRNSRYC